MDIPLIRAKVPVWLKKYKYVVIVLLLGILFMLLPVGGEKQMEAIVTESVTPKLSLEITSEQLELLLSQIKGAGKVKVLLTYAASEQTVYHADEKSSSSGNNSTQESKTVSITGSNRNDEALVTKILAPEYQGAVVLCQGAENPAVQWAISEAVSKATGLGTDKISVLRMK